MSRIEELIKEKCPDGVEYKSIGKVCKIIQGFAFKSNTFYSEKKDGYVGLVKTTNIQNGKLSEDKMVYINPEEYPKLDIKQYTITKDKIVIGMSGTIKVGINNTDNEYLLNQRVAMFITDEEQIITGYLNHLLHMLVRDFCSMTDDGSVKNLSSDVFNKYEIPVPPIEVQQEIVRILDNFTELEVKLQNELETRKKQYEYYSEMIFNYNVESDIVNVTDICDDIFLGLTTKVDYVEEGGVPLIRANNMTSGKLILDDVRYISKEQHTKLTKIHKPKAGDILVSKSGTLGVVCIVEDDIEFSIYESLICLQPNEQVYNKYLLHMLRSPSVQKAMLGKKTGNAIKHLNLLTFRELFVPLPSLEKQYEIANILETFEDMCRDLDKGLPAEIEARHKQYEYYRDKLLTFERKVV